MTDATMDAAARTMLGWGLGWAVRSAVVVIAAALIASQLRTARLRAHVWTTALALSLVLPLLVWTLPPAQWSVPPGIAALSSMPASASVASRLSHGVARRVIPPTTVDVSAASAPAPSPSLSPLVVGVCLYLAVAMIFVLRFHEGWLRVSRLRGEARVIDDPEQIARAARLAARCGVSWTPTFVESDALVVPAVIGFRSPAIALPADWREWTDEMLESVLIHEMTHIARGDTWTIAASQLLRAVAWGNPAMWWLQREIADAVETACDEVALETGVGQAVYAETLLTFIGRVSSRVHAPTTFLAMARAGGQRSEARIERVLTWQPSTRTDARRRLSVAGAIVTIFGVALVASISVQANVSEQTPTSTRIVRATDFINVTPPIRTEPALTRALRSDTLRHQGQARLEPRDVPSPNQPGFTVPLVIEPADQKPADPVIVTKVDPVYTQAALDRKIEGNVDLDVVIAPDGRVGEVRVTRSLDPTTGLDDEAVRAARQWVFHTDGKSPTVGMVMEFRLNRRSNPVGTNRYAPRPLGDPFAAGAFWPGALGVQAPVLVNYVIPKYTSEALSRRLQGTVEVEAVVLADGSVRGVRILRSIDPRYGLDANAIAAARAQRFLPGTLNGQPVPVLATWTLDFVVH
jgi:TonB family protein